MAKVKSMSIPEFLHGKPEKVKKGSVLRRIADHVERHSFIYKVAGTTLVIVLMGCGDVYAATGLDEKASSIYYKLAGIGKWVIIVKGAIEIIQMVSNGDFDSIKKKVITYVLIYVALLGLPWGMEQVEELFKGEV